MAAQSFRIIFTQSAWVDLEEIVAYWTERAEPERGEKEGEEVVEVLRFWHSHRDEPFRD